MVILVISLREPVLKFPKSLQGIPPSVNDVGSSFPKEGKWTGPFLLPSVGFCKFFLLLAILCQFLSIFHIILSQNYMYTKIDIKLLKMDIITKAHAIGTKKWSSSRIVWGGTTLDNVKGTKVRPAFFRWMMIHCRSGADEAHLPQRQLKGTSGNTCLCPFSPP